LKKSFVYAISQMYQRKWNKIAFKPEEEHHDSLVQTIESRIPHAGAVTLERARNNIVLVFVIEVETEDVSSESVVHSVETSIAWINIAFN